MSVKTIFVFAFLLFVSITIAIPSFPPAELLYGILRIQPAALSILGFPIAILLNGVTNGFFWLIITAAIYSVANRQKYEPLPPMPPAPHLKAPPPEPMPVDWRINKIPPAFTVPSTTRKHYSHKRQEIDIENIEGISPFVARLLRNSGINSVNDLLKVGAKERGRLYLSEALGVSEGTLLRWIYRGDLIRTQSVGKKYSTLLESAGVRTVTDLSRENPRVLHRMLLEFNRKKKMVNRVPPCDTIEIWVNNAKTLEPIIE